MKKYILISIFVVGFVIFVILMEMLNVDHILNKLLTGEYSEKTNKSSKLLAANSKENINFIEKEKIISNEEKTILHPEDSKKPLKLTKEEIGRHSWALIHSIAAAAPNLPTEEDKENYKNFFHYLSKVYPCKICATHFAKMLQDYPFRYKSREDLVYYLCELHNNVNVRLAKPVYECKKAFDIWGSDCGCDA